MHSLFTPETFLFVTFLGSHFLLAQNGGRFKNQQHSSNTSVKTDSACNCTADNTTEDVSQRRPRLYKQKVSKVLEQLLKDYDPNLRPGSGTDSPDQILVDMYVVAIVPINEVNMEFTTTFFIRNYWRDYRLAYGDMLSAPKITIVGNYINHIWKPDLIYESDLSDHVTRLDYLLWLTKNGSITYSVRKRIKAFCPMAFHNFPLDEQKCELSFESFAYSNESLDFEWNKNAVAVSKRLKLTNYELVSWKNKTRMSSYSTTGNFRALYVEFIFRRNIGFYVIQIFIPAALIVAISWVSFWIDERSIPARVSLGITTVLAITTLLFGVQSSMPKVGHVKAADVYLLGSFVFVFGALVEYSIICYLERHSQLNVAKKSKKRKQNKGDEYNENMVEGRYTSIILNGLVEHPSEMMNTKESCFNTETRKRENACKPSPRASGITSQEHHQDAVKASQSMNRSSWRVIDKVSRVVFPALYIVFIVAYLVKYKGFQTT